MNNFFKTNDPLPACTGPGYAARPHCRKGPADLYQFLATHYVQRCSLSGNYLGALEGSAGFERWYARNYREGDTSGFSMGSPSKRI